MPRNKDIKIKNTNLNVKFSEDDYKELQKIADDIGGITLSSMIRILIYSQLDKVKKAEDPRVFMTLTKYKSEKVKNKIMNVKLPEEDYKMLQHTADSIGVTLSLMIRMLIYSQLDKVRKSKDPRDFLTLKK
ncbi:hypothetical protein FDB61_17860 [Clostridium botulinum]|nr:hypothetical protein [Clostridium botulinum]